MSGSPFKLLDAYTAADRDQYFGREEEEAALYDMVLQNRLMLIYGQTGTGKTSLIQCGLSNRFDVTDWYPIFIRRQQDLNASLRERLAQAARSLGSQPAPTAALEEIYATYLRPAYLIFDQLEEIFILGTPTEQETFAKTLRDLLQATVPCRILLVIREEYLAWLYGLERIVPTLFDRRLRVEPMTASKVRAVLHGSFRRFQVLPESPADHTYTSIIEHLSGGKSGIQLPYLQVYLDLLYQESANRQGLTQPVAPAAGEWPLLQITRQDVAQLGKIENVLDRFLHEQRSRIQADLKKLHPGIEDDVVQKVLDAFVSEEGTKRPVKFETKGHLLVPESSWAALFTPLPAAALSDCCRMLEQVRLLRFADQHAELAHDSLAALIDSQRSDEQRRLNNARNSLLSNYRDYRETGEYLSRRQLTYLDEFLAVLMPNLAPEIQQFLRDSEARVTAQEQAEVMEERRKRKQARRVAIGGFTLAALALVGLLVALQQYRVATAARSRIAKAALEAQRESANTLKAEGKYVEAISRLSGAADQFADALNADERQRMDATLADWERVADLDIAGYQLVSQGKLREGIEQYRAALSLGPDPHMEALIGQTQRELEARFDRLMLNGKALLQARQLGLAAKAYQDALRLKPDHPEAQAGLKAAGGGQ